MKDLLILLLIAAAPAASSAHPLFPSSVTSNDLDFILANDPGACWSIQQTGSGRTEMYNKITDEVFVDGAIHFDVSFPSQTLRINVNPKVGDPAQRAAEVAASVSRLPEQMRQRLLHVNIHDGDRSAWAEEAGQFFTLYEDNMAVRLANHDLDETVFHETAHVALDPIFRNDLDWLSNQAADGDFITEYARDLPDREDVAESALFVWTMKYHPGRLPSEVEAAVQQIIPNRLEYMGNMLDGYEPPSC